MSRPPCCQGDTYTRAFNKFTSSFVAVHRKFEQSKVSWITGTKLVMMGSTVPGSSSVFPRWCPSDVQFSSKVEDELRHAFRLL